MDFVRGFIDFVLHLDVHLAEIIQSYGAQTYALLFAVVFLETGVVVTPIAGLEQPSLRSMASHGLG